MATIMVFLKIVFSKVLITCGLIGAVVPSFSNKSTSMFSCLLVIAIAISVILGLTMNSVKLETISGGASPPSVRGVLGASNGLTMILILVKILGVVFGIIGKRIIFIVRIFSVTASVLLNFICVLTSTDIHTNERWIQVLSCRVGGWQLSLQGGMVRPFLFYFVGVTDGCDFMKTFVKHPPDGSEGFVVGAGYVGRVRLPGWCD